MLKWLFPFLVVLALFVWGNIFMGGGRKKESVSIKPRSRQVVNHADFQKLVREHLRADQRAESPAEGPGWDRDPFFLNVVKAAVEPEMARTVEASVPVLHLDAVVVDSSGPVAVINGEELSLNGRIGAFTVTEISEEKVMLNDGRRTVELFR
ncbi:MAG: hypothetical protein K8I00_07420 [Candidatus Omnitrophica bacterium]|nr:hypothetical protein [Candidatus Omnitrophota bacterium]